LLLDLTFTAAGFLSSTDLLMPGVAAEVALLVLTLVAPEGLDDPFLLRTCTNPAVIYADDIIS
jgi:hypothetical protein